MKRRRTRVPANPFAIWTSLAVKSGEMMLASAQVISHRTGRMASAGAIPNTRDQKEFTLMGQEKIEAATESAQAIAAQVMRANQQLGRLAFEQWMAGARSLMTTSAFASSEGQAKLVRSAMQNSAEMASHLSGSVAQLAHHGLKPIHSRATGNAKRLGKITK
jgi:hypothetical protein